MATISKRAQTVLDTFPLRRSARISVAPLRRTLRAPQAMASDLRFEEEPLSAFVEEPSLIPTNFESSCVNLRHPIETKSFDENGVRKNYYRVGKKRRAPVIPNAHTLKSRLAKVEMLLMFKAAGTLYVWDNLRDIMDSWDYEDMVDFSGSAWIRATDDVPDILWPSWTATTPGEPTASAVEEPTASASERPTLPEPDPSAGGGCHDRPGRTCSWTQEAAAARREHKKQRTQSEL